MSTEGGHYDSDYGMRSALCGPVFWMALGLVGRSYPIEPTIDQQIKYSLWLELLADVFPCGVCRTNILKNLETLDWKNRKYEIMQCRQSFSRFINEFHNCVNKILGKPEWEYEDHRDFFETFRAKCDSKSSGCSGGMSVDDPKTCCVLSFVSEEAFKKQFDSESYLLSQDVKAYATQLSVESLVSSFKKQ